MACVGQCHEGEAVKGVYGLCVTVPLCHEGEAVNGVYGLCVTVNNYE